jgi:hypothetical protein
MAIKIVDGGANENALSSLLVPTALLEVIFFGSTAFAGCTVPFTVFGQGTEGPFSIEAFVHCSGPWGRMSDCVQVPSGGIEFYCAYDTLFSMYGNWRLV